MLKFSSTVIWRLGTRSTLRKYSSTGAAVFKTDKIDTKGLTSNNTKSTVDDDKDSSGKNNREPSNLLLASSAVQILTR